MSNIYPNIQGIKSIIKWYYSKQQWRFKPKINEIFFISQWKLILQTRMSFIHIAR